MAWAATGGSAAAAAAAGVGVGVGVGGGGGATGVQPLIEGAPENQIAAAGGGGALSAAGGGDGGACGATSAAAGGRPGGVQPGGGGIRVQHMFKPSWPDGIGQLTVSRRKKTSGPGSATGLGFGGDGGPLGKCAHSGFGSEFGANGTTGGAGTQPFVISYCVVWGKVIFFIF